jgi:NAD(P)-dependent dehydrogenase (short-subunit alcohol dehydrogenase family)
MRRGGAEEPAVVILTNSAAGRQARGDDVARSVSRGALANLASSLARAESEAGVHIVHAVVDGWIRTPELQAAFPDRPDEWIAPDRLADAYWQLFTQPPSAWTFEPEFRCHTDSVDT